MAKKLHVDIETYSSIDIKTSGAYKYAQSPDFEILLIAYAIDDEPVNIIDLAQDETLHQEFVEAFLDPNVKLCAHNAAFERNCFNVFGFKTEIDRWHCSLVKAAYCGYPLSLENVSKAMKLEEKGKLKTGKELIKYFCNPVKPTKSNGMRKRNMPWHDPEKWSLFKLYCKNDVEAEREIDRRLEKYGIPEFDRLTYIVDQGINDRGVEIDLTLAENAIEFDERFKAETLNNMYKLTGLDNPNSPTQLKSWLSEALGENLPSLTKDDVTKLLEKVEDKTVREVLEGRLKLAKTSVKKYTAMKNCACGDSRAYGLFQFYGANRTGRWTGKLIQLQNLPQNHMKDLAKARDVISSGDYDLAMMLYDSIPNVLSELIRTAFVAPKGCTFAVSDFSAIEARVLSWVADEEWRLDVFKTHGKIYEASASMMFNVPIESVTKGSELRQRGKTAELALGYQGGTGALTQMDKEGRIPEHEKADIVAKWREANPKIVKLWNEVERHAIHAITSKKKSSFGCLTFENDGYALMIGLPSGRKLSYVNPRIGTNRFGNTSIVFKGMDQNIKQWTDIETYGGKLVENIVQAISRDLLAESMIKLDKLGYRIVMHIHDELVCEVPKEGAEETLKEMERIMGTPIPWAPGLPLKADGYITNFYKKD